MPRISVIMSCYNAQEFISEAIESVLNQTFKDFEFIIINDGSSDETLNIIKSFNDKRIIIITQENKGLAFSLNRGIKLSKGKYIARIDADDICLPERFLIQYKYMQNHPNIDVLGCAVNYIDKKGNILGRSFPVTWSFVIKYMIQNKGNVVAHPTVFIRRDAVIRYGYYAENMYFRQDFHLWNKILRKGAKIKNLSYPLVKYRISNSSISARYQTSAEDMTLFNKILKQDNPSEELLNKLKNLIENRPIGKRGNDFFNIENRIYLFFKSFGVFPISSIICFLKNCINLLKIIIGK